MVIRKYWIKVIYKIIIVIIVVGLCSVPFIWNDWFFETHTAISEKLKYVGAFLGGIFVAVNAYFIYERANELNRSNNLVAKGQLDTRFKDAATLLAAGNTSSELSGIHALHQIAIEASKTKDQRDYVKVIKDILITFIKENSVIEYKKNENGKILYDEYNDPIVEAHNTKSKIVLQTIIDKLFRENEWEIYAKYSTDLTRTVLNGINFYKAQLQNAEFYEAQLHNARFLETQLQNASFWRTQLHCVGFLEAKLQGAYFRGARLQGVYFRGAQLQGTSLEDAKYIDKAHFKYTRWNEKTNFNCTAFENKTIEELTKIMGNSPISLDK